MCVQGRSAHTGSISPGEPGTRHFTNICGASACCSTRSQNARHWDEVMICVYSVPEETSVLLLKALALLGSMGKPRPEGRPGQLGCPSAVCLYGCTHISDSEPLRWAVTRERDPKSACKPSVSLSVG